MLEMDTLFSCEGVHYLQIQTCPEILGCLGTLRTA